MERKLHVKYYNIHIFKEKQECHFLEQTFIAQDHDKY